jgi:hypothetical protein
MRELFDRIKEAKPQVFFALVSQKIADQWLVTRPDRPDKYPPAAMEDEMPLPFGIVSSIH